MIITLTDPDGIQYSIESNLIDEVSGGIPTIITLQSGEKVKCIESASFVMKYIIDAKFGSLGGRK